MHQKLGAPEPDALLFSRAVQNRNANQIFNEQNLREHQVGKPERFLEGVTLLLHAQLGVDQRCGALGPVDSTMASMAELNAGARNCRVIMAGNRRNDAPSLVRSVNFGFQPLDRLATPSEIPYLM